jgi:hypothetical protein
VRKTPTRYFFAISLLLAVGGCDEGGGPPPPMVLNTDPVYDLDGPDPNVVPVVGDLGGPLDYGMDEDHLVLPDQRVVSLIGDRDDLDDSSSLDGWLGILDSGYEPTQIKIILGGDVVPVVGDLGGPIYDERIPDAPLAAPMIPDTPLAIPTNRISLWEMYEYNHFNSYERYNNITNKKQYWCDDCEKWENETPIAELRSFYYQISAYNNDNQTSDIPLWNGRPAVYESWMNPLQVNDVPSQGWRSFQEQHYDTLKDSKTQELPQDTKIFPGNRNLIGPGSNPFATTDKRELEKTLLKDATTPTNSATPGDKGLTGVGNPPTSPGSDQVSGRSKADYRENLRQQEVTNTPAAGKSSATGGKAMEESTGLKNSSLNNKNSLEEKSFKNSVGEKSPRSTFTGEKVFSQQGSKSFAPMGGKTFSGTGTRAPTSGKSFKMRGF